MASCGEQHNTGSTCARQHTGGAGPRPTLDTLPRFVQGRCDVKSVRIAAFAACVMVLPMVVAAQDFGVMNSAETINKGNFKLTLNPIMVFGKGIEDNDIGVAVSGGYGFTDRFDAEAKLAVFDGLTFFGADAEYWVVKGQKVDFSVAGGFHLGNSDGFDTTGLDLTLLASGHVGDRLELYGALDFARNKIKDIAVGKKPNGLVLKYL